MGYSKSLMLFHMLRQQVGDEAFNQRIKQLWARYQFQTASYRDVIRTLHEGDKEAYEAFIAQWLNRTGAPELSLGKARVHQTARGYRLKLEVHQEQTAPPYTMQIPVQIKLAGVKVPSVKIINLTARRNVISLDFAQRPQAVTLDPNYDVFRLLDPAETPSSLGRLFGSRKQLLVLPTRVNPAQRIAWQQFAAAWSERYDNIMAIDDSELSQLPEDSAVWLLGWQNKLLTTTEQRFNSAKQQLQPMAAIINNQKLNAADHAVVLLDPDNSRSPLGFIGAGHPDTITLLARKLPHYSTYGLLAFELPIVNNIIKQSLPVTVSPLSRKLK